jgi:D-arabinose 5-phosphate isomerase GutQ
MTLATAIPVLILEKDDLLIIGSGSGETKT